MSNSDSIIDNVISLSIAGLLFYMAHNIVKCILSDESSRAFTWIKPGEYKELQKIASKWAIERTLSLLPPDTPLPVVKRVAKQMQGKIFDLYGVSSEAEVVRGEQQVTVEEPEKVTRKPVPKTTEVAKEKVKVTPKGKGKAKQHEITQDMIEDLTSLLVDTFSIAPALVRQSDDELARTVTAWAEVDFELDLPYDIALKIAQEARKRIAK